MKVDVNKPVENPELLKFLNELDKTSDENKRNDLLDNIAREFTLKSNLLSIVKVDDDAIAQKQDGQKYFKQDSTISFVQFKSEDDKVYFPAFTDWNELRKGDSYKNEYVKTLIMSFDDYFALVKDSGAGVVINPYSHNLAFTNGNLQFMKQRKDMLENGHTEVTAKKDTHVLIGDPKEYPEQMVKAITDYSKTVKDINAIWLKLMVRDEEKSYLLVVDFKGEKQKIFSGIADAARDYLPSNMYIDMVPYDGEFGQSAAKTGKPFYQRKRRLFGLLG